MFDLFNYILGPVETENLRLQSLKYELKPAFMRGVNHCVNCGYCCSRKTCIPTPRELIKIAKFFKLTPIQLINKYFVIDFDEKNIFHVRPAGENNKDCVGKLLPADKTWNEGRCIFLDKDNKCKIHSVKPKSAKILKCWDKKTEKYNYDEMFFWSGDQLFKQFGIDSKKLLMEVKNEVE